MEVADVEEELGRLWEVTPLRDDDPSALTPEMWKELESHNYLHLRVGNRIGKIRDYRMGKIRDDIPKLSSFLLELLTRRNTSSLKAILLQFPGEYPDLKDNAGIIVYFSEALSSASRVYLE